MSAFVLLLPLGSHIFLQKHKKILAFKEMKEKYENLYTDISLKRDGGKYTLLYYPLWMLRRFMFAMFPVIFLKGQGFQI